VLIYAVCSLEKAEGEAQIDAFLAKRPDFGVMAATTEDLPAGIHPTPEGMVRTGPQTLAAEGAMDGFFIARLQRHLSVPASV
jgi:16S rRNA (cytosine967-C5)-methyltransferase